MKLENSLARAIQSIKQNIWWKHLKQPKRAASTITKRAKKAEKRYLRSERISSIYYE